MKPLKVLTFLTIFVFFLAGCQNIQKIENEGKVIDGKEVVAQVNGEYILKSDFDRQVNQVKSVLEANGQDFSTSQGKKILKDIKNEVLNSMIDDMLILQQAQKENISLEEEEFEKAISELEIYYGGSEALDKYLKQQGFDREAFEASVRDQLIISRFRDKLTSHVKLSDEEVKKYYEENKQMFELPSEEIRASHILVDTEDEAKNILNQLKSGADFEELAKKYSKDIKSKDLGGDVGYFSAGKMVPEFEKAAFELKPGEISDVVKTEYGYHIIKVTDKRTSLSFEDAKEYIKENLENTKKEEEFSKYLEEWKKQSEIEKYL